MQASSIQNMADDELSLHDILRFLKGAYKTTAIAGASGLIISATYLAVGPKRYEAVAQISMAQISAVSNTNMNASFNPMGVNIEEPSLLISRLSSPTSYTPQVLTSCGINDGAFSGIVLSKSIKLTLPKGVPNVVELKAFGQSPEAASICAQAIFDLIKDSQAQIAAPYIAHAKNKLDDDVERLSKAKDVVAKADRSGSAVGAAYLSTRDEIRFLLDEITILKSVVTSNQSRATRLIAPIYASDIPVAPKNQVALAIGLFGGLFLGLLLVMVGQMWVRLKANLQL